MLETKNGDFYCSVEEAASITGQLRSQILRRIADGLLSAHLAVPRQQFLVCTLGRDRAITGYASCEYSGVVRVHKSYLEKAVNGESFSLDGSTMAPVELGRVSKWCTQVPYSTLPIGKLAAWKSLEFETDIFERVSLMPLPTEVKSMIGQARELLDGMPAIVRDGEFATAFADQIKNRDQPPRLIFRSAHTYSLEDVRIRSQEISVPGALSEESKRAEVKSPFPAEPPLERIDELACIIWRVVCQDLDVSERDAWQRIREDVDRDRPNYDLARVLVAVDQLGLTWLGPEGDERHYSRGSFPVRLSRLKGLAKKHLAEFEDS